MVHICEFFDAFLTIIFPRGVARGERTSGMVRAPGHDVVVEAHHRLIDFCESFVPQLIPSLDLSLKHSEGVTAYGTDQCTKQCY